MRRRFHDHGVSCRSRSDCPRSPTFVELERRLGSMNDNLLQDDDEAASSKQKNAGALSSDELLFQVFPKHVAKALKAGRKVMKLSLYEGSLHKCRTLLMSVLAHSRLKRSIIQWSPSSSRVPRRSGVSDQATLTSAVQILWASRTSAALCLRRRSWTCWTGFTPSNRQRQSMRQL